ncbi:MAG: DUF1549 domain-containing protein [Acidobacteriota bacterium]
MKRCAWMFAVVCALAFGQTEPPDFARQVHPLLVAKCGGCHNPRMKQGGLALNTRAEILQGGAGGPAVKPGDSASSLLVARVLGERGVRMPLNMPPLTAGEVGMLRRWIDAGARASEGPVETSWKPSLVLRAPSVPDGEGAALDRLMNAYWKQQKLSAPGVVSDAQFARRAYLDLWGLLPTPEELRQFETGNESDKRARLVETLLADPERYADNWISFWNDHLRNDEGVVYHGDRQSITPWLKKALLENMPYDRFVRTLLNPVEKTDPAGFLIGVNWRGDVSASQIPVLQAAQNSAQIFMGINLKCNSCHDSFISQWKLKDAYGLASFFSETPLPLFRCDVATGETASIKFLYPELGGVPAMDAPLALKRAAAAELFTNGNNGRTPRTLVNRYWRVLFGRGLVEPVDDMDAEPWSPEILDWLAADFVAHNWDVKYLLRTMMNSTAYAAASAAGNEPGPYVFRGPLPKRLTAEQFSDAVSSITGEWRALIPRGPGAAKYVREWQMKSTPLTRALGRPIRDQVLTERVNHPTMLEELEVVNGSTMATSLWRGARRMMGVLPAAPKPLFDSGVVNAQKVPVDVALDGAKKVWLVVEDVDSYDPGRTRAGWAGVAFAKANGAMVFKGDTQSSQALLMNVPSMIVVDTKGAARLTANVGVDVESLASDINPRIRFFVFREEPDLDRLIAAEGETPVARPPALQDKQALVDRVFLHALARKPSAAESAVALEYLRDGKPEGLEDLLWSVLLSPEFQYVR